MNTNSQDYNLFFRFIEKFKPIGYTGIDPTDPLMMELEDRMDSDNQFIYIADAIQMNIHHTSQGSLRMIGIPPKDLSFYHFMEATHPDDIQRLNLGRAKILKICQELFIAERGFCILSTNFRMRTPSGNYSDFLIQTYAFFTAVPYKTVFFLKIHTKIDWHKKIKHGYHYYVGNDPSYFRYPDEELLQKGNVFSEREFVLIRLIENGLNSEEIAEKLFLSVHTVNTHRRNILIKTGKPSISELIYDLKERGVL